VPHVDSPPHQAPAGRCVGGPVVGGLPPAVRLQLEQLVQHGARQILLGHQPRLVQRHRRRRTGVGQSRHRCARLHTQVVQVAVRALDAVAREPPQAAEHDQSTRVRCGTRNAQLGRHAPPVHDQPEAARARQMPRQIPRQIPGAEDVVPVRRGELVHRQGQRRALGGAEGGRSGVAGGRCRGDLQLQRVVGRLAQGNEGGDHPVPGRSPGALGIEHQQPVLLAVRPDRGVAARLRPEFHRSPPRIVVVEPRVHHAPGTAGHCHSAAEPPGHVRLAAHAHLAPLRTRIVSVTGVRRIEARQQAGVPIAHQGLVGHRHQPAGGRCRLVRTAGGRCEPRCGGRQAGGHGHCDGQAAEGRSLAGRHH